MKYGRKKLRSALGRKEESKDRSDHHSKRWSRIADSVLVKVIVELVLNFINA